MRLKILILAVFVFLVIVGCGPTDDPDDDAPPADINEAAQIYAAAINQIYTVDHSFGQSPGWPLLYVVATTDDTAMVDSPVAPSQAIAAELQEAVTAEMAGEPFELIWIETFDKAPIDTADGRIAGGDGIIITLGNIHPQDDGSVQVPFFMTCGGLCGIGKTYVLNLVSGDWQITGSVGPEIMS